MVNRRGQLLLVGSLFLAVVIIGSVYTLNSLQQTHAIATTSDTDVIGQAEVAESQVRSDLSRLVSEVNESLPVDPGQRESALKANLTTYENHLQNMTLRREGTYVKVGLRQSAPQFDLTSVTPTVVVEYEYRGLRISYNRTMVLEADS